MNRDHINAILEEAAAFFDQRRFPLPPFAQWTPEDWRGWDDIDDIGHIVNARLGWDVTDYGKGDFGACGLTLFTVRNGRLADLRAGRGLVYAEKAMITRDQQLAPMHRHYDKVEDIINRGGGDLILELYPDDNDTPDRTRGVTALCDGIPRTIPAGEHLRLTPGESVTLTPDIWHAFWGEGDVFVAEVSTVNDDETDNLFEEPIPRFPTIHENASPTRLLVCDYTELTE